MTNQRYDLKRDARACDELAAVAKWFAGEDLNNGEPDKAASNDKDAEVFTRWSGFLKEVAPDYPKS